MKKTLLLTFLGLVLFSFSYGQATIKGKVIDKKSGETLIGVTISLESKPGVGVTTDLDGNYTLILPDASAQTLIVSYISYETKKEIVKPVMGETIIKDFTLQSVSQDLGTIEVQGKASKDKGYYMEEIKKNSAASIDFISSETMKKTGDVNVTSAVARVSGVSINNGFVTVRGIGDRYVKTTINGSRIPTLDPFTNNIRLDLFPASLIDNVVITKTASPDLPGDWAGAYISLETKDYPDKLSINAETSVGYNNQTTFKEVVTSADRSETDWLGYDNGFREFDHNAFTPATRPDQMSDYQTLVALGLGDYYTSMGINKDTKWDPTYFNLGLVKLGLLDPAFLNNQQEINKAKAQFNSGPYRAQAAENANADYLKSARNFNNNWNLGKRQAPLNFSQSFSIGNQTKLFGRTLGVMAGFRYGSGIQYDPNSITQTVVSFDTTTQTPRIDSVSQKVSRQTNTWSALLNLNYKFNINNSISFIFMPNFNGVNNVRDALKDADPTRLEIGQNQFYEARKQLVYQFKSQHIIPGPQLKLDLNASYTNGKSDLPDYKRITYIHNTFDDTYQVGGDIGGEGIHRYFRYLTDNLFDSRVSAELPFKNSTEGMVRKLRFGGAYQYNYKKSDQYDYGVLELGGTGVPFTGDLNSYFDISNFELQTTADGKKEFKKYYSEMSMASNHTFGQSSTIAGFIMTDYSLFPSLRFVGGLRVEKSNIFTDITSFYMLGLKADDPRRTEGQDAKILNAGKLNNLNYLPSATLIYKLNKDEAAPTNLRLNYSETVVRPSIRELSNTRIYDYELRQYVIGNPNLQQAKINNYDLRWESYFKSGDNISASVFYKDFKNHIELVSFNEVTWQNVDKSNVIGLELEGRKSLIKKCLEFRANVTFVHSQTTFVRYTLKTSEYVPVDTITRPMFGQAPYIINGILTYTADSLGLTLTLSYNIQGPRLAIASVTENVPDIYEMPRNLLDFKVTKKLGRYFGVSLTVRDILNAPIRRAYKFDNWDTSYDRYTFGTNYVLGVTYKF